MAQTQALTEAADDDIYIGDRVHSAMWRARVTQTQLAAHLGLDQAAVSRRLRGRTSWKASEVRRAAALLGVAQSELLPPDETLRERPVQEINSAQSRVTLRLVS